MKKVTLQFIPAKQIVTLRRNPQYLTPKQMESLKASMKRDGFAAPILVRPLKNKRYEVISGNHRFMAAGELGIEQIPCVVMAMDKRTAQRLAVNLNTIHGDPNEELLAPFLAEMDEDLLKDIHLEDEMFDRLCKFDTNLAATLKKLDVPDSLDTRSNETYNQVCTCPKCGRKHIQKAM